MVEFTLMFDETLKLCWVRGLCPEDNQKPWKFIPLHLLANAGGTLFFFEVKPRATRFLQGYNFALARGR